MVVLFSVSVQGLSERTVFKVVEAASGSFFWPRESLILDDASIKGSVRLFSLLLVSIWFSSVKLYVSFDLWLLRNG